MPAQDVEALENALERVLFDEAFIADARANVRRIREQFCWQHALAPLVDFVRSPSRSADHASGRADRSGRAKRRKPYGLGHDVRMFWHYLRAEGPARALRRVTSRLRRRS